MYMSGFVCRRQEAAGTPLKEMLRDPLRGRSCDCPLCPSDISPKGENHALGVFRFAGMQDDSDHIDFMESRRTVEQIPPPVGEAGGGWVCPR